MARLKFPPLEKVAAVATIATFAIYVWVTFHPPGEATPTAAETGGGVLDALPHVAWRWPLTEAQTLSLSGLIVAGGLHVLAGVMRRRERTAVKQVVVFVHDTVGSDQQSKNVTEMFRRIGWHATAGRTSLPQHAIGVRILGGTDEEREFTALCLKGIGIESRIEVSDNPPPTLQVVIGAPDPALEPTIVAQLREYSTLVAQRESLTAALAEAQNEREDLRGQLGGTTQALGTCKQQFALARISWFARQIQHPVSVKIRFADYADFALAERIKEVLAPITKWTITIDGTNNPVLRPADGYKVVFVFPPGEFDGVAAAFSDGKLLDCTIGQRWDDAILGLANLVIEVLPTVKSV